MYKVKIKKDIECRGVEYKEGESYEVGRVVRNFLLANDAVDIKTKKSKKKETSKDLDIS
jgi:hypothetical protein|tara:strand:+ start:135 stop:311 length:177 start_codon:yes stop_codon:yes gene_type:complete